MITNNYKLWRDWVLNRASTNQFNQTDLGGSIVKTDGTEWTKLTTIFSNISTSYGIIDAFSETATDAGWGYFSVLVGSGSTAATVDDHALVTPITEGLTQVSAGITNTYINGVSQKLIVRTIQNTSASDITISEVGLYKYLREYHGNPLAAVLLDREVLDTPVVLTPGAVKTFTFTIQN